MPKPFNINLRQTHSSQSADKSNVSFGFFHRVTPFRKVRDIISFNLKKIKGRV